MRHLAKCVLLAGAIGFTALAGVAPAATILHYDFNETGNAPGSDGTNATPVKMRNDAGTALDFHSVDGGGVSGLPGDRSFANTGPDVMGSVANAAANGFRADQPDLAQVDTLSAFTISGWFKTENATLPNLQGRTPRLVNNYTGSGASATGFNLQFLSGSEGDLKIDIDDDSAVVDTSGTGARYSGKQKWVFFAVSYDGTLTTNNVNFYIGFRDDAEAGGGPGSANVSLVKTVSLNRGAVNTETALLAIGNRPAGDRPFDGFLDEIRIDNAAQAGAPGLAVLESYRLAALEAPRDVELRHVSSANVAITSVPDQNAALVSIPELSGITYDPSTDRFWAVGDNDGRLVQLDVDFDANGAILSATAVSAVSLANILDFEGIAFTDAARDSVFLAEENNPGVREYSLATGNLLQMLGVPTVFGAPNLRSNRGFEGVARSPSALEMLTGVEQALTVDGPAGTSATVPAVSRMLRYAVSGNVATEAEQYAYVVEPVHATTAIGDGSSLSDLIILPNGEVLTFERSDAASETLVRAFLVSRDGATDVSQGALGSGLIGQIYVPVAKSRLFSDASLGKFEGIAAGPTLANGVVVLGVEDAAGANAVIRSFVLRGDFAGDPCAASGGDGDGDAVCTDVDNCPAVANPGQENADGDASGDACDVCPNDSANDADGDTVCADVDNCPAAANPGQENADGDASGDACDVCPNDPANDSDGDLICGGVDNCPLIANPGQENADGDANGDACDVCPIDSPDDIDGDEICTSADNCPAVANSGQENADADANGDACDVCPNDSPDDVDGDGVCTSADNCPATANPGQENADADASGDACDVCANDPANDSDGDLVCGDVDNCPQIANPGQENADSDANGDACDVCANDPANDADGDSVCADVDNCPLIANALQENADGDANGDACDVCPNDSPDDVDGDGVCTSADNCPATANPGQQNADADASGDACDVCPNDPANDGDGDLVCGDVDNCPLIANPGQENADSDASGDACDVCANDPANDADGDSVCADVDNCPLIANALQENADGDASGDACDVCPNDSANDVDGDSLCADVDNCPLIANALQENADGDASGDACDVCPNDPADDADGDSVCADLDNCPLIANGLQENADGDASGDACDVCPNDPANDADGDAVCGDLDNCPSVPNPGQEDGAGGLETTIAGALSPDGVGDACDNCVYVSNPRMADEFLTVNPWATLTGGQRDDDHDGYGNRCDAKFVGLPSAAVGGLDLGQFRASNNEDRRFDTCGTTDDRPCAIFDLDEAAGGNAIGGLDLGRFRQLNLATPGPRCEACTGTGSVPLPCTAGTAGECGP